MRAALTALLVAGLLASAPPAFADVDPNPGASGVGIGVRTSANSGGSVTESGGRTCSWTVTQGDTREPFRSIWAEVPPPAGETASSGQWARWDCSDGTAGIGWMPTGRPIVAPEVLARQAYRYLPLPAPKVHTNPPVGHDQLLNMRTWLWVDLATWGSRSATASVPGLTATVRAVPVSVTWTMGDGGRVVCTGPGNAYDPARAEAAQAPGCSYTYRQAADAYTVVATTTWRITWTADGATGGTLPPLTRTSPATRLRVVEVQAINQ